MADPQTARLTQLRNIQSKTGRTIAELHAVLSASGLAKTGELRSLLMERFKLGYGDANAVALLVGKALPVLEGAAPATKAELPDADAGTDADGPLDSIYSGAKAHLRPLHDAVMAHVRELGSFEVAPKLSYVSLRRRKQFAMMGPATRDAIEIGLNHKALGPSNRLKVVPPGGMCQYKVRIAVPGEVDAELQAWLKAAYEGAA
jgi:hypothetical protein